MDEQEWETATKKRITAAFQVGDPCPLLALSHSNAPPPQLFDKEKKGVVVQEEVPTILRYLGVYPSEKMLIQDILPSMQGDEPTAFVTYAKLEEVLLSLIHCKAADPDPEDILLQAFRTLDADGKGYIEWDRMKEIMQTMGDAPFRDKEIEQFQRAAMDIDTGYVFYEDYVATISQQQRDNH
jgi:Ca2+-binding EF-hand superfamily protein